MKRLLALYPSYAWIHFVAQEQTDFCFPPTDGLSYIRHDYVAVLVDCMEGMDVPKITKLFVWLLENKTQQGSTATSKYKVRLLRGTLLLMGEEPETS